MLVRAARRFAFEADCWASCVSSCMQLKKVFRQVSTPEFSAAHRQMRLIIRLTACIWVHLQEHTRDSACKFETVKAPWTLLACVSVSFMPLR